MITGREPNILKHLEPIERARLEAAQDKAILKREKEEQKVFDAWLRQQRDAGKLWVIHPRMDKASTIEPGTPDYVLLLSNGRTLLIEMKAEGGKLSSVQQEAALFLANLDHPVNVAWGHVAAIRLVKTHLEVLI